MILNGFVGPTYDRDATTFDAQRCVNLYPIASESRTSKSVTALRSIPGYTLFATAGGGPIRGGKRASNGRGFVVSGYNLYEINTDGTTTSRGTLNSATGRVGIADNGVQLIIVDGVDGYTLTFSGNTFAQIADADFPACDTVAYLDGYFIVNKLSSQDFYISNLNDGTAWDTLDFSNAAALPDNLVAVLSDSGNLWLLGAQSTEAFQNTGNAQFPFERIPGAVINTGCAAAHTALAFDNSIIWLGQDDNGRGIVWRTNGYSASRLSTHAIEEIIATVTDYTDSYAYTYHEKGHAFYVLQISGLNRTLVYDVTTGQWHERLYYDNAENTQKQHRGACHIFFDGKNLIGDNANGNIYQQSLTYYDYNGEEIHRMRISPHYHQEKANIPFSSFELDVETGMGLTSGQGSSPQVMMQYSDDGGRTWSKELWRTLGALGKYKTRVRWARCGSARDRVWKVQYTEPTFFQINEAYINAP